MNKKILFIFLLLVLVFPLASAFDWSDGTLVSYYKFDETSGSVAEDVHGTNNGTIYGNPILNVPAKINTSYYYDGTDTVNVSNDASLNFGTSNFSVQAWINSSDLAYNRIIVGKIDQANSKYWDFQIMANGSIRFHTNPNDNPTPYSSTTVEDGSFYHVVAVRKVIGGGNTNLSIYVNGVLENSVIKTTANVSNPGQLMIGAFEASSPPFYEGVIDEVGIWNRTLNPTEITELYNSGNGLAYQLTIAEVGIDVTLQTLENNTITTNSNETFNSTLNPGSYNLTNATQFIWFENGTLFNETFRTFSGNETQHFTVDISNLVPGDFYWNVLGVQGNGGGLNSSYADNNFTFEFVPFEEDAQNFDTPVLETSEQDFIINISTAEGFTVNSATLIYNGTSYGNAEKTDLGGGSFSLKRSITIPQGEEGFTSENRSFFWNITINDIDTGESFFRNSTTKNQTVNELIFRLCGGDASYPILNFTMYDENLGTKINATANPTTFQAFFEFGIFSTNLNKNYSIDNQTVNTNTFDFCTGSDTNQFFVEMESFYTAENYADNNYFLNNASVDGNNTNEISLYLLNETDSIEFFIDVERDLLPLTSTTVSIAKYFVGEGAYKTIGIKETSSDTGEFTAYLDLDQKYRFTITKDGELLDIITKTASCSQAPCELTLSLESGKANVYEKFSEAYASDVLYNLTFNPNTKIVDFEFIDITGLANSFQMLIYQSDIDAPSSLLIYNKTLFTSSGSMSANLSNYTDGDFRVETYVSRSPYTFIDFLNFTISDITVGLGLLGLFIGFLFILVIIFGLAFSPIMLVFSIPLALTITKMMALVNISTTSLILIYILAAIAAGFMTK